MKIFVTFIIAAFACQASFASEISRVQDTTIITCEELNAFLESEKLIVLGQMTSTYVVSEAVAKTMKATKACPSIQGTPSYKVFHTQTKDQLKCRLGVKCSYVRSNPPVPKDPPGF